VKILVIDDSRAVHSLLGEMLQGHNIALQRAYNGQEGLDALSARDFAADMVLLDWEMPILTGIDALPQLVGRRPGLPIVMMTSKNAMADITEALSKGAVDYIIKPFTQDILIGKISQVCGREVA
jgi:two-component system chemotaxis response regulator CheY